MAAEAIHFPDGKSGNILRGALGLAFRQLACVPQCENTSKCELTGSCPYARIFEPLATGAGASGLWNQPRPFVIRAAHLDGRTLPPGETFHFDLHVFDMRDAPLAWFVLAFAQVAREGIGPRRGRARLQAVWQLGANRLATERIYDGERLCIERTPEALCLELTPGNLAVSHLAVTFLTPTELKSSQNVVERPDFSVLFARARDRVSTLRALYAEGPLELDFRAAGERAAQVRMTSCEIQHVKTDRRSSRTGQVHSIGGFVGEAHYSGNLTEFLPLLEAASWTGVGRQTVWGKGAFVVQIRVA